MIVYEGDGDVFSTPAQTLCCTVNVEGAMGRGIALQFRKRYPKMYQQYRTLCKAGYFHVDQLWSCAVEDNRRVLCFPTKQRWALPSRPEWIEANLQKLARDYERHQITSLALPALGCGRGTGGLSLSDIRPLIRKYLDPLPIDVYCVYQNYVP